MYSNEEKKKRKQKTALKNKHNFKIAFLLNPYFPYQSPARKLQVPTYQAAKQRIYKYMFSLHTSVRDSIAMHAGDAMFSVLPSPSDTSPACSNQAQL